MKTIILFLALAVCAHAQTAPQIRKIAGEMHKLTLLDDGSVAGWGDATYGQLGPVPDSFRNRSRHTRGVVRIALPRKAVDIAAGSETSYALLDDGAVMAWGRAHDGELGIGEAALQLKQPNLLEGTPNPVQVPGIAGAVAVAAGGRRAYAILADGSVVGWGGGRMSPARVEGLANVAALSVAGHTLALLKDGRVMSWGSNMYMQLGHGQKQERPIAAPALVEGLAGVVSVSATTYSSLALMKDGSVWVWGSNATGHFGNGQRPDQYDLAGMTLKPVRVAGVSGVAAISAAITGRHVLALHKSGAVTCWGNSDWGQCGAGISGDFQPAPKPARIGTVKAVWAAGNNSLALRSDGSLWMWGAGSPGEFPLAGNVKLPAPAPFSLQVP